MLDRRLVVLLERREHEALKRLASAEGVPVGKLVREVLRTHLSEARPQGPSRGDAVAFLCGERDSGFDWYDHKREYADRYDEGRDE